MSGWIANYPFNSSRVSFSGVSSSDGAVGDLYIKYTIYIPDSMNDNMNNNAMDKMNSTSITV